MAMQTETHVAPIQETMDFVWQWNVVGNVDPASTTSTSISKIMTIDYHTLSPKYHTNEVRTNISSI